MHVENAGQLLPYVTSEQVERLDEVCAVLRHALDVVPKDWPHQVVLVSQLVSNVRLSLLVLLE